MTKVNTAEFCGWEAHTRGIGSKLLLKMGYELGKGKRVSLSKISLLNIRTDVPNILRNKDGQLPRVMRTVNVSGIEPTEKVSNALHKDM